MSCARFTENPESFRLIDLEVIEEGHQLDLVPDAAFLLGEKKYFPFSH